MGKKGKTPEERQLIKVEEMSLEETQMAEQLYNSAGLDSVVDAGLKDYDKRLQQEDKLIVKVLGPRGSDIKGYGEAVAKRVALAIYAVLNKQYGGKVGDLRSYIMALEDERDRANARYDELMGRAVGILGEEYKELRTDSKAFMEKLTTILGEDVKESKINQEALAEKLADIDGLRSQVRTLQKEKDQQKERYESEIRVLRDERNEEVRNLKSEAAVRDSKIEALESEEKTLKSDLAGKLAEIDSLKSQIETLVSEGKQQRKSYESQITALQNEHNEQVENFRSQIIDLDSKIEALTSEKAVLQSGLEQLREDYSQLKQAITTLAGEASNQETGKKLGDELYAFLLKDTKVPHMVIDGVGKFIDFRKYLGLAVERGVKEVCGRIEQILGATRDKTGTED